MTCSRPRTRSRLAIATLLVLSLASCGSAQAQGDAAAAQPHQPGLTLDRDAVARTVQTVALFALVSLAPVALLMTTAFVRINITLTLLRQAMGSPQVPGNNVITALALLLSLLVMRPHAELVYQNALLPYAQGKLSAGQAWDQGVAPIKGFMVGQIVKERREHYLTALYERSEGVASRGAAAPARPEDFSLSVVAPAFLLSEITAALRIGFFLYLPFLVIDLAAASILSTTGLYLMSPALIATPAKLIVFVLADGWMLTAAMLLDGFAAY